MSPEFCWGLYFSGDCHNLCRVCEFAKTIAPGLNLAFARGMKKPRKQSAQPAQWTVHIMRAKLTCLGSVEARDKAEAMDKAMRQLDIREADRFRISVRRE